MMEEILGIGINFEEIKKLGIKIKRNAQ